MFTLSCINGCLCEGVPSAAKATACAAVPPSAVLHCLAVAGLVRWGAALVWCLVLVVSCAALPGMAWLRSPASALVYAAYMLGPDVLPCSVVFGVGLFLMPWQLPGIATLW